MTASESPVCALPGCDEPLPRRQAKFCCRDHSLIGQARMPRKRSVVCRSGEHPMTGDNTYVDGRGHRRCKACVKSREFRRERPDRPNTHLRSSPSLPPVAPAHPLPAAPVVERPVWRPAGWGPVNVTVVEGDGS